jgi:hypothetical protein
VRVILPPGGIAVKATYDIDALVGLASADARVAAALQGRDEA